MAALKMGGEMQWISGSHASKIIGDDPSGLRAKSPICLRSVLLDLAIDAAWTSSSSEEYRD
jgi:hypothetical protein